ncbi:hypothetical protein ACFVZ6_17240, partial [Streptomyces sp. NPDC059597]
LLTVPGALGIPAVTEVSGRLLPRGGGGRAAPPPRAPQGAPGGGPPRGPARDGRIVSPPELADSARRAAREALAAYESYGADDSADGVPEGVSGGADGTYERGEHGL